MQGPGAPPVCLSWEGSAGSLVQARVWSAGCGSASLLGPLWLTQTRPLLGSGLCCSFSHMPLQLFYFSRFLSLRFSVPSPSPCPLSVRALGLKLL